MIYINLANSLIAKAGDKSVTIEVDYKKLATKVALMILPIIGLLYWESYALNEKKLQLESIQAQDKKLEEELAKEKALDETLQNVAQQKKDLDDKFNVVHQIFSLRNQKLRTLYALRDKLPQRSWLKQVVFRDKTVSIIGYSSSIDEASSFAQALNDMSELFASVNTTNTASEKINGGEYFKFDIFIKLKE